MTRALLARLVRLLLVAGWTGVVFVLVVLLDGVVGEGQRLLLPFVAAGVAAAGMVAFREPIDRLVRGLTHHRLTTPYSVLAQTTARVGAGSLQQALPGLAQVLAEGTGAQRAALWLAVGDRLVEAARRANWPHSTLALLMAMRDDGARIGGLRLANGGGWGRGSGCIVEV